VTNAYPCYERTRWVMRNPDLMLEALILKGLSVKDPKMTQLLPVVLNFALERRVVVGQLFVLSMRLCPVAPIVATKDEV